MRKKGMSSGATLDGLVERSIAIETITQEEVVAMADISLDSHPSHLTRHMQRQMAWAGASSTAHCW
ncbi:hypothetical protein XH94_30715 [Bradyrhizobium zhanjiangense]|uniref:Uncharacterized protein n=1 Tax=Bradyrhizobium zhanjiangense TaxID=1325107 RepID=A0A4Q0S8J2_9BRAD|nr:hypothetical protein XH94_30715 [Bradyrhizobium zhanjiangense]